MIEQIEKKNNGDITETVEKLTRQVSDFVISTSERFDKLQVEVPGT